MSKTSTKANQNKFLKSYEKHLGIVSAACKETGISRQCFYKWKKDEGFMLRLKEVEEYALEDKRDKSELQLMQLAEKGNAQAIIHINKTLNRKRGYADRLELDLSVEPITLIFGDEENKND